MKRNRIILALLTCFLVFLLAGMYKQPVYAVKANEVGISLSGPTRSYNNETGNFGMKYTLKNLDYKEMNITAYLYNADGKCVTYWDNGGKGYSVKAREEVTKNFVVDYTKFPSSSYTFVYQVKVYNFYNEKKCEYEDLIFKWKATITKEEACGPSINFKKATLRTLNDGSVVPRINYNCRNIKGQTLKIYIYDEYGDLVYQIKGKERPSNNENNWFTWNGKDEGDQQYPDGNYTVKIVSSGGVSVSKKFYFDFPYNNK
ncbi:MAG: FlgD immunoglobulin-like domain containing protein [Acetatifactor sp.]